MGNISTPYVTLDHTAEFATPSAHVLYLRVVELVRRLLQYVFRLPHLNVASHYMQRIVELDRWLDRKKAMKASKMMYSTFHTDQQTHEDFEYNALLYLSSLGEHFGGGAVDFWEAGTGKIAPPWPRSSGAWYSSQAAGRTCTASGTSLEGSV